MITLIFPTQGNPLAVLRTIESASIVCDEIIIGSVCVFHDDRKTLESYKSRFNIKIVDLGFSFIYQNGFSSTLNLLASLASNPVVCYLNVGEIIERYDGNILDKITNEYNCWYIDHLVERHRWWRVWRPSEMKFDGLLHEEIVGDHRPFHKPIFRFADTEKDNVDALKSMCYDDLKELCYFNQLCRIVEDETLLGATSFGWLQFAKEQYDSMQERLAAKGARWEALRLGDYEMYMNDVLTNPQFEKQRFESSLLIEYQNSERFL